MASKALVKASVTGIFVKAFASCESKSLISFNIQ